jgi:hypothetical protein
MSRLDITPTSQARITRSCGWASSISASLYALIRLSWLFHLARKEPDCTFCQLWQIPVDEPGVFSCEFDFATEAQIITDQHLCPSNDASRENLVVAVPESKHPTVIVMGLLAVGLHETEIAMSVMREAVSLRADLEVRGCQGAQNGLDELDDVVSVSTFPWPRECGPTTLDRIPRDEHRNAG